MISISFHVESLIKKAEDLTGLFGVSFQGSHIHNKIISCSSVQNTFVLLLIKITLDFQQPSAVEHLGNNSAGHGSMHFSIILEK